MNSRFVKLVLAVWWLVWAGFIVPAHTRGIISVDGTVARGAGGTASFFMSSLPSCCQNKSPASSKVPKQSGGGCAICMIVANTGETPNVPPVILAPQQASQVVIARVAQVRGAAITVVYQGRAPPGLS